MNCNNYGYLFNNITIKDNKLNKKSKNTLGQVKINYEIDFYLFINKNNINFPMPELINYENGSITIQYIENSTTLIDKINSSNLNVYIDRIKNYLNIIHSNKKEISNETIISDISIELNKKILNRFNEFDWNSNLLYNSIKYVNNIKIKDISYYCNIIQKKITTYLKNRNYYNLIHGDIHLGNILLDNKDNIYFIDPRGYFGETKLFGLYEYDYAKLLFGLSGYSSFDNMSIDKLNIINNNINIDFIKQYEYIFEKHIFDEITVLFCLSIWLANNSSFLDINKKITSLMIAFYYCEKYIDIC
jgi:tRNA A-37 threonylcarbamoyl transferase component Bud32